MATGDILAWISSDDWYEKAALSVVADFFKTHDDCFVMYGDETDVDEYKNIIGTRTGDTMSLRSLLKNPDIVRQPDCFWRKEVTDTVGYLDESLHLVMDYEYFPRIAKRYTFQHISRNLCFFRIHKGAKTSALAKKQIHKIYLVMKKESGVFPYSFCLLLARRLYWALKRAASQTIRRLFFSRRHKAVL